MKKGKVGLVVIILIAFLFFGTMVSAFSPIPTGGFGISVPPDFFIDLIPPPTFAPTYTPGVTKLNLSEAEAAALGNMTPGTSTLVQFNLPFFFGDQALIWSSSDPGVASVTALPGGQGRINATGSGTALITVSTPDGSFSFSFFIVVN